MSPKIPRLLKWVRKSPINGWLFGNRLKYDYKTHNEHLILEKWKHRGENKPKLLYLFIQNEPN